MSNSISLRRCAALSLVALAGLGRTADAGGVETSLSVGGAFSARASREQDARTSTRLTARFTVTRPVRAVRWFASMTSSVSDLDHLDDAALTARAGADVGRRLHASLQALLDLAPEVGPGLEATVGVRSAPSGLGWFIELSLPVRPNHEPTVDLVLDAGVRTRF